MVLRFVVRSVAYLMYLLPLPPRQLKCVLATGICRETVLRVTFITKKIKGLWVGPDTAGIGSVGKVGRI